MKLVSTATLVSRNQTTTKSNFQKKWHSISEKFVSCKNVKEKIVFRKKLKWVMLNLATLAKTKQVFYR